jgi:hypothetical protein
MASASRVGGAPGDPAALDAAGADGAEAMPPGRSCAPGVRRGRSVPWTVSLLALRRISKAARQPSSAALAKVASSGTGRGRAGAGQDWSGGGPA